MKKGLTIFHFILLLLRKIIIPLKLKLKQMKKLIILTIAIALGLSSWAQETESYSEVMRSALKTEKKAMIAEVMTFTQAESEVFWPIYNEYQTKLYTANSKYLKIIKEFADNFEQMSDDRALDLMKRMNAYDSEILKLKKSYTGKFSKILPATKVLRYFQAENKINVLIKYEIAAEVPLLEVK